MDDRKNFEKLIADDRRFFEEARRNQAEKHAADMRRLDACGLILDRMEEGIQALEIKFGRPKSPPASQFVNNCKIIPFPTTRREP